MKLSMKKAIIIMVIMTLFVGGLAFVAPQTTDAQTYQQRVRGRDGRYHWVAVRKPSYYRRHRNRINMAIGTGGGAVIGGLIGGGKGALIGAGVGAGSSALYTYKLNKKKRHYRKVRHY